MQIRADIRSLYSSALLIFFFFFQAEDGIRDSSVTGVQTCPLPISVFTSDSSHRLPALRRSIPYLATAAACFAVTFVNPYFYHLHQHIIAFLGDGYQYRNIVEFRSEERRVGTECRSRWSPDH